MNNDDDDDNVNDHITMMVMKNGLEQHTLSIEMFGVC
jgi:IS5 family transposase